MPAAEYDFDLDQGADFDYTLTFNNPAGAAVNLTGYSARLQMREGTPTSPDVALELSTANGRIVLGGVAGTIELVAPAALTATLEPVLHSYDLELISGLGATIHLIRGKINVIPAVTR